KIRDITEEDKGIYHCTVNTSPIKHKVVTLHVKVPARINHETSSNDTTIREGDTTSLFCNATGTPEPQIKWKFIPSDPAKRGQTINSTGSMLIISNATRDLDGKYECTAENLPNSQAVKRIKLTVQFPPEIFLSTKKLGQTIGRETILECKVRANPHLMNVWMKVGNGTTITPTDRLKVDIFQQSGPEILLSLRIRDLKQTDYGPYDCIAENNLGIANDTMILYG
ncbi:hypothetical protein HELRODRAFT_89733, partial [Helobdella robusta]|uniref:Ig-like domain-containing protein n=1 Tax=Helobdella robusta TaxID=6412 RepID=T1G7G8_HELRO